MRHEDFIVTIGGIDFRPISLGSLTLLHEINSPIIYGGEVTALDFTIFAWMHAEPLEEVINAVKSDTYESLAIRWGADAPPCIFSLYTVPTLKALSKDLKNMFIDKESGFIPFVKP